MYVCIILFKTRLIAHNRYFPRDQSFPRRLISASRSHDALYCNAANRRARNDTRLRGRKEGRSAVITAEETLTIERSDSFAVPQSSEEHTTRWRMRLNLAERGCTSCRMLLRYIMIAMAIISSVEWSTRSCTVMRDYYARRVKYCYDQHFCRNWFIAWRCYAL